MNESSLHCRPRNTSRSAESDESLMGRVRDGSASAFAELVERWQENLLHFFVLAGASRQDADDLVQETFLRLFAWRSRFRAGSWRFRSLLFRIARNAFVDAIRRRRRRQRRLRLAAASGNRRNLVEDPTPSRQAALDVREAVQDLPDRLRWVVVLSVFEGLPHREVAEVLDVPVGTVKSRLHHALRALREVFGVVSC